jgi:hypothetical protein
MKKAINRSIKQSTVLIKPIFSKSFIIEVLHSPWFICCQRKTAISHIRISAVPSRQAWSPIWNCAPVYVWRKSFHDEGSELRPYGAVWVSDVTLVFPKRTERKNCIFIFLNVFIGFNIYLLYILVYFFININLFNCNFNCIFCNCNLFALYSLCVVCPL